MMSVAAAVCTSALVLAATLSQVAAIGSCNNTLIKEVMTANADNCPTDLLKTMYEAGPQIQFRVMPKSLAALFSCATGVLERPENNVAVLYNKFSHVNESLGYEYVNYTMVEASCGVLYKHIVEESYVGFKVIYAYADGISFGYYGCTNEDNYFSSDNDLYVMCYAPAEDTPEVEASLLKCKAHMEAATGHTDLVLTPACDNDNEFLDHVLAKDPFRWLRQLVG